MSAERLEVKINWRPRTAGAAIGLLVAGAAVGAAPVTSWSAPATTPLDTGCTSTATAAVTASGTPQRTVAVSSSAASVRVRVSSRLAATVTAHVVVTCAGVDASAVAVRHGSAREARTVVRPLAGRRTSAVARARAQARQRADRAARLAALGAARKAALAAATQQALSQARRPRHVPRPVPTATATPTATPTTATPTPTPTTTPAPVGRWAPTGRVSWQWQLSGTVDTSVAAEVYDVDWESSAALVASLHAQGRHVVCYLSAGSYEKGRPDAAAFPAVTLGKVLNGWPDEKWLDVRRTDLLAPVLGARMDSCRAKGFDAVEADNVDGYSNDSGFPLTAADQLAYNRMLARLAHDRGLSIGLKNDLDQVVALQPDFDFAVNEQCAQYKECAMLTPFVAAGKSVLHAEYGTTTTAFCPTSAALGLSSIRKKLALDAWRETC